MSLMTHTNSTAGLFLIIDNGRDYRLLEMLLDGRNYHYIMLGLTLFVSLVIFLGKTFEFTLDLAETIHFVYTVGTILIKSLWYGITSQ